MARSESPVSKIGRIIVLLRRNTQFLESTSITRREQRTIESPYPPTVESSISNPTIYLPKNLLLRNSILLHKFFQLLDAQNNIFPFYNDLRTFDTLHLVAFNLYLRLSLVQLDLLTTLNSILRPSPTSHFFVHCKERLKKKIQNLKKETYELVERNLTIIYI